MPMAVAMGAASIRVAVAAVMAAVVGVMGVVVVGVRVVVAAVEAQLSRSLTRQLEHCLHTTAMYDVVAVTVEAFLRQ